MSENMTPKQIVNELDKYIIGQKNAKRAVAIALRSRWRRQNVSSNLIDEISPKNIIMIGPTGVGKTEIARRLAKIDHSPFIKLEASKFTEVGYVGRDVESMIRDLVELSINIVKLEEKENVKLRASNFAEERILDLLLPIPQKKINKEKNSQKDTTNNDINTETKNNVKNDDEIILDKAEKISQQKQINSTREKLRKLLKQGKLNDKIVDIEFSENTSSNIPMVEIFTASGIEDMGLNIKDMLNNIFPQKKKNRKVTVPEAIEILTQEEIQRLIDIDKVHKKAIEKVEQSGIIFLDEIDKIVGSDSPHGPDVSREGVQRDLLPIVEGATVNTKYGMVKTDHILFIAAGAFSVSKPSDLIPELQGRFPIRVELDSLGKEDFVRILQEPNNALIKQYTEMLATENVKIIFKEDAIQEIAAIAANVNERTENIGARRLYSILEKLLEEISFNAPEISGQEIIIDVGYVKNKLLDIIEDEDLSRYIL